MTPKKPTTVWVTVDESLTDAGTLRRVQQRTATDRSTTSTPGPMRWEIARKR